MATMIKNEQLEELKHQEKKAQKGNELIRQNERPLSSKRTDGRATPYQCYQKPLPFNQSGVSPHHFSSKDRRREYHYNTLITNLAHNTRLN